MKLYRIAPVNKLDILNESIQIDKLILVREISKHYADIITQFMSIIQPAKALISKIVYNKNLFPTKLANGQVLEHINLENILYGVLIGDFYIKIRDDSFRFIHFGWDCIMYVCLGHEDGILIVKSDDINMSEVSAMLIETDVFDN